MLTKFKMLKDYLDNVYWCVIPFATFILFRLQSKAKLAAFDIMQTAIEIDDTALSALKRHRFSESELNKDYRVVVPRGKYCPEELMPEIIELEIESFFYEQLSSLMQSCYLLNDRVEISVSARYLEQNDSVLVTVGYDNAVKLVDMKRLVPINLFITILLLILTIVMVCII
jgi:hypothetical protein